MRRGRKWAVYLLIHYFATVSQPTFFFSLMIVESLILSLTAIQLYVAMGTAWSVIFSHSALGKTNTILVLIVCSYSFVSLNYSKHIFCFIILAQKKIMKSSIFISSPRSPLPFTTTLDYLYSIVINYSYLLSGVLVCVLKILTTVTIFLLTFVIFLILQSSSYSFPSCSYWAGCLKLTHFLSTSWSRLTCMCLEGQLPLA